MKKGDYKISDIYQGGYSSFTPASSNYANNISSGTLGMTTDPRNANILQEVSTKLSSGTKHMEVEGVNSEIFDSIPKQYLKEVNRLSKLTGVDVSLHGPVIDVSGMSQQGFSEGDREIAERRIVDVLKRARELNPDGNIPVNFHSSEGIQGSQIIPDNLRKEGEGKYKRLVAINREDGKIRMLEAEKEFYPGGEVKETTKTPEKRLDIINDSEWKTSLFQIEVNRENAERIMQDIHPIIISRAIASSLGKLDPRELSKEEKAQINRVHSAGEFIGQAQLSANSLFSKAYEIAKKDNDKQRMNELNKLSEDYGKMVGIENGKAKEPEKYFNPKIHSEALHFLGRVLEEKSPKIWVPFEDFAVEKASQSFGNATYEAYKEFKGKNVPILVIENPPAGFALSTGEELKNIVEKSREKFIEKAKEGGMSASKAKEEAEKLIGATLDVGHMNMLRKQGYTEKDIIKEAEKVAPFVKHVHLSDNFGFEHTELPMGMGNVPLKEMMNKLGEKGFEGKKIIEAAQWWQHFKTSPFQESLEAMGSPLYSMNMAPYWNQAPGLFQGYSSGYGEMLPQINYETFGAGFSRLPQELGGSARGAQGNRMSGRPME